MSGLSADLRTLRLSTEPAAHEAIELFTHRVIREAGALLAVLGGIDLLAFTGGIGEHDAPLRRAVAWALGFAGVRLDAAANDAARGEAPMALHPGGSRVVVWAVPSDEGHIAARAAFQLLNDA